jgi:hypothetical protein
MFMEIAAAGESVKQLRNETRMKVLLTGELTGRRGIVACRIVDISRGGACLDADRALELGEIVSFSRGTLHAKGKIVWARGKRLGVRFEEPIRATELLVQMSHSRTAAKGATKGSAKDSGRAPQLSAAPSLPA